MLTLDNVATQDKYVDALTLGPVATAEKVIYLVANASVVAQVAAFREDKSIAPWGQEILLTPQQAEFQRVQGVRFRSAQAGTPARIIAQLVEPGDVLPIGGTPFTSSLTAGGVLNPLASNVLAVGVNATPVNISGDNVNTFSCISGGVAVATSGFKVPAGSVVSGSLLRLKCQGGYLNNTGVAQTLVLTISMNGGAFWKGTLSGTFFSAIEYPWSLEFTMALLPNSVLWDGYGWLNCWFNTAPSSSTFGTQGSNSTGPLLIGSNGQSVGQSPAQDIYVDLEAKLSNASGNQSFRTYSSSLELMSPAS